MAPALGQISRLKSFFRTGLNYSNYEQMISVAKRKASGSFPTDVISCVTSNGVNKKSAVQGVEKMLNEATNILGEVNTLEKQCINRLPDNASTSGHFMYFLAKNDLKGFLRLDSLYAEKEVETIIKAEEKILTEMKKYIPDVQNVVITPLGSGMFGNGYKLQVLGKDGKQLFGDKVLKVYREDSILSLLLRKNKRINDNKSDEKLVEECKKQCKKFKISMPEMSASAIREMEEIRIKAIEAIVPEMKKVHGAIAEANTSEFLRFHSGHKLKPEDGIAIPSYFGLGETKFALGEFIGKERKAKKEFNFNRLFLEHQDLKMNPANGVNGICIDIGGITPVIEEGKVAFSSKENLRILKTLLNCPESKRKTLLEEYKKSGILTDDTLAQIEQVLNK